MKVKELLEKYPNYRVDYMGHIGDIPFTMLPKELKGKTNKEFKKIVMEMTVYDYQVNHTPSISIDITHLILGGKKRLSTKNDGYLIIALRP